MQARMWNRVLGECPSAAIHPAIASGRSALTRRCPNSAIECEHLLEPGLALALVLGQEPLSELEVGDVWLGRGVAEAAAFRLVVGVEQELLGGLAGSESASVLVAVDAATDFPW
jgi:hypothetical protein